MIFTSPLDNPASQPSYWSCWRLSYSDDDDSDDDDDEDDDDDDDEDDDDDDDSVDCISKTSFGTNLIGGKPHRQQIGFSYKYK